MTSSKRIGLAAKMTFRDTSQKSSISHNLIHNYIIIMDVFIVMEFNLCDDHYYGFRENLLNVCGSFDEAKAVLDARILKYYGEDEMNDHNSFSRIIRMQMGNTVKEILYDTSVPRKKKELCIPVDTESDDKGDEFLDSKDEELWRMECERMDEIDRRWFEVDHAEHNRRKTQHKDVK